MTPKRIRALALSRFAARITPTISGRSVPISPNAPASSLRSKRIAPRAGIVAESALDMIVTTKPKLRTRFTELTRLVSLFERIQFPGWESLRRCGHVGFAHVKIRRYFLDVVVIFERYHAL